MYKFRDVTERIKTQREKVRNRLIVFDSERVRILTEAWPEIALLPPQIRVAEGLYRICSKVTCPVEDFELIAGYSAYFVELTPDCQNDIIARTENAI